MFVEVYTILRVELCPPNFKIVCRGPQILTRLPTFEMNAPESTLSWVALSKQKLWVKNQLGWKWLTAISIYLRENR